jgi:hypothetical protein
MAPVTLLRRHDLAACEAITTSPQPVPPLSPAAEATRAALEAGGALFFEDLLARLRLLPSQLETALSELAGQGLAACDGFAGLRALCARAGRRRTREVRAAICEATQTCEPPPHGVSVLSLPEHTKRERVFIEYRNPVGIAQRDGVPDEEIQTFTLSGSVEDLDQVKDSAGRPLR